MQRNVCLLVLVLSGLIASGCGSPTLGKKDVRDHLGNFPPQSSQVIDGLWEDPWGDRVQIECGRMYKVGFAYPQVTVSQIEHVGPGKYKGRGALSVYQKETTFTFSIVAPEQLLVRTLLQDIVYTQIELDNPQDFHAEFEAAQAEAELKNQPEIDIKALTCQPDLMKPAVSFDMLLEYTVSSGAPRETEVPVQLSYSIYQGDQKKFSSKPTSFSASSGVAMQRVIHLTAAQTEGRYRLVANLTSGHMQAEADCAFTIAIDAPDYVPPAADDRSLAERLAGTYEVRIPGYPTQWMKIISKGDTVEFLDVPSADNPATDNWQYVNIEFVLNADQLWYKTTADNFEVDSHYVMQTVVNLTGDLKELPFKTTVVQGDWTVRIGEVWRGTMIRLSP